MLIYTCLAFNSYSEGDLCHIKGTFLKYFLGSINFRENLKILSGLIFVIRLRKLEGGSYSVSDISEEDIN